MDACCICRDEHDIYSIEIGFEDQFVVMITEQLLSVMHRSTYSVPVGKKLKRLIWVYILYRLKINVWVLLSVLRAHFFAVNDCSK